MACSHATRNKLRVALLFIDLDDFKDVNDSLGHEAGDQVLKIVAGRLREGIRASDTAARPGGDEFLVLLNDVKEESSALKVAEALLTAIRRPMDFKNRQVTIGASIGLAFFPDPARTAEELLEMGGQGHVRRKKMPARTRSCCIDRDAFRASCFPPARATSTPQEPLNGNAAFPFPALVRQLDALYRTEARAALSYSVSWGLEAEKGVRDRVDQPARIAAGQLARVEGDEDPGLIRRVQDHVGHRARDLAGLVQGRCPVYRGELPEHAHGEQVLALRGQAHGFREILGEDVLGGDVEPRGGGDNRACAQEIPGKAQVGPHVLVHVAGRGGDGPARSQRAPQRIGVSGRGRDRNPGTLPGPHQIGVLAGHGQGRGAAHAQGRQDALSQEGLVGLPVNRRHGLTGQRRPQVGVFVLRSRSPGQGGRIHRGGILLPGGVEPYGHARIGIGDVGRQVRRVSDQVAQGDRGSVGAGQGDPLGHILLSRGVHVHQSVQHGPGP